MGTRADFYIGSGVDAEWLGSVAWNGYGWEEDSKCPLMRASSEDEFRAAVAVVASEREDFTAPAEGWPWPWDNSRATDYAYCFLPERGTLVYYFGKPQSEAPETDFPDMKDRQNIQWGRKSGVMIVSAG